MANHIDFEAKSDRDLIILTAQTCNNISKRLINIDILLLDHGKRLVVLETTQSIDCNSGKSMSKIKLAGWVSAAILGGSLLAGFLYAFGASIGWW